MTDKHGSLGDLYDRHVGDAVRLGYLLTGDEQLAQGLAHEAFVRLLTRFRDLRNRDAFGGYLRRTIVNLARDHHRRAVVRRRYLREYPPAETSEPVDAAVRADLWSALGELPVRQRAALVLRYYEDMSEAQVADVLGCSPAAAKSLIARATQRLRAIVREMELN